MNGNELVSHLLVFLRTGRAKRLCRDYRIDPADAIGELYHRLIHLAIGKQIKNLPAWISGNGFGLLRNWLRG